MLEADAPRNPTLFRRVFYSPVELRVGWRLLVFLMTVITLISASNALVHRLLSAADNTILFLVREVMDFLIFLFASWIMGRIEGRTIAVYGLPWQGIFRVQFWRGLAVGFTAITALLVAMRAVGVFNFGSVVLRGTEIWRWALIYALVFLLVALREEFRTRGYGLFTLSAGIGFWPAAILSSAFFGYGHHGNSGEDWIGLFNAGAFGLLACFLLRRTGNLWMSIGLHMAFDWGETFFYGVANSGKTYPGQLMISSPSGPAWLSGGSVGPEASLLYTLLTVFCWILCSIWLPDVEYPTSAPAKKQT